MVSDPSRIELEVLVLRADREAVDRVGDEEVMLVVDRQRPEAVDRRRPSFGNVTV
jgi:hypothetical protein